MYMICMFFTNSYNNWPLSLFVYIFISSSLQKETSANDVLGCNGFVRSNVGEIDYTQIEVKLFTKQGSLKERAELSPKNGYYFLPLYDKGEYILKVSPPVGWHFEPLEMQVNVDGVTDSCSSGNDINFVLQGFAVTGQVTSFGSTVGPRGVAIKLAATASPPDILLSTTTGDKGQFTLSPVKPGQFILEASHERWTLKNKHIPVSVGNKNTVIPEKSLVISGYDVSGKVTSDNEPIMGVSFVLFQSIQAERIPVTGCDSSALTGFSPSKVNLAELTPICHVASDAKGLFTFPCVPSGAYTIVPHYKSVDSIKFDVHPQRLDFSVKHDSLQLPTTFQVKGFSVDGRVLASPSGKPLEGAIIMINQKVMTKTGADGIFHLDSMTPGVYELLVQANNVQFKEENIKVTANSPHVGDIVPSAYSVCGRVSSSHPGPSASVVFESSKEAIYKASTNTAGSYCIFLPPNTYSVSMPVTQAEKEDGLQFSPLKRVVTVVDDHVTDVDFSQLRATVRGSIKCLSNPCPKITVILESHDTITVLSTVHGYVFEDVLPGECTVSVASKDWCWHTEQFQLVVSTEQVQGPTFVQTGIPINFISSHSTKVRYMLEGSKNTKGQGVLEVTAGNSRVCVALPGVYIIEPVGCHGYSFRGWRWLGGPITLTAISHLYSGKVLSSEPVSDLIVNVIPSEDMSPPSRVRKLDGLKVKGNDTLYTFSTYLAVGEAVILVPTASYLLFSPQVAEVVGTDQCVDDGVVFRAEKGHLVEGRVLGNNAPISGASVAIYNAEGQLITTQVTDSEGRYLFGPLSANIVYNVTAKKEGYVLTGPNSKGEFNARKLAEVIIKVKDKDDGKPLQGVLLSLNGGEDYRRAILTGSDGTQAFVSLSPGEYYLRPMMKEYQFDPHSKVITVQEGATVELTVRGERVAFSVWGSVTSLSGYTEPGVVVEAVGLGPLDCSQFQEESTTEASGQFRIRGLLPECEYSVRVKQESHVNQHIQRATPDGIAVKVSKEDVRGLHIVVFRPISRTDISVYVTAENPDHLRSLKVIMFQDDLTVHTARLFSLKATPSYTLKSTVLVFPPVPADGRTYTVQLESTLSPKTLTYQTRPVYFKANTSFQVVRLNFVTTTKASDNDLSHTSYLSLPLLLIALLVVYKRDEAKALVTHLMDNSSSNKLQLDDSSGGETLSVEQISLKRKLRQRKLANFST